MDVLVFLGPQDFAKVDKAHLLVQRATHCALKMRQSWLSSGSRRRRRRRRRRRGRTLGRFERDGHAVALAHVEHLLDEATADALALDVRVHRKDREGCEVQ